MRKILALSLFCLMGTTSAYAADAQECSVEMGAQVASGLAKLPKETVVLTFEGQDVQDFLEALKQSTGGKLELPPTFKLVFVSVGDAEQRGWKMIGYGPDKDGMPCVMGALTLPAAIVAKAIEKMALNRKGV